MVLRPGGSVPDRPPPRPPLATGGGTGSAAPRVHPQRDGQGVDAVPSRRRAGARRGCDDMPQRGVASLAEAGVIGDPGRLDRTPSHGAGLTSRVGTLAAGAVRETDAAGRAAPLTD